MASKDMYVCKRKNCFYYHKPQTAWDNTCNYALWEHTIRNELACDCTYFISVKDASTIGKQQPVRQQILYGNPMKGK